MSETTVSKLDQSDAMKFPLAPIPNMNTFVLTTVSDVQTQDVLNWSFSEQEIPGHFEEFFEGLAFGNGMVFGLARVEQCREGV